MVLMFEWVLKFRIWVLTVMIGTYVYGILVIDGYLCSRVYIQSIRVHGMVLVNTHAVFTVREVIFVQCLD